MICPFCRQPTTQVTNSRPRKKTASVWRRRHCSSCKRTYSTTESVSLQDDIQITSASGSSSSAYNRGILLMSIAECFAHNPARGRQSAWWLTETIENQVLEQVDNTPLSGAKQPYTLHSSDISTLTHQVLQRYDESAAIQYAARHNIALA